jgi:phosphoserine aminotransferase
MKDTYFRLEEKFLDQAKQEGLIQLKGHSTNKGIRASCYNAMPVEGAQRLA